MTTHFSRSLADVVERLVEAPEQALARVAARFSTPARPPAASAPTADHIVLRLERVFEAMTDLPVRRDVEDALELACDTLQYELPSEAIAVGVYDIDADEIRIAAARGAEQDLLRGTILSRARCFMGRAPDEPFVTDGADWIGAGENGGPVLLCPVMHEASLFGVVAIADPLCAASFEEPDVELVRYVAERLAAFIQTVRLRPSLPPAS